CRPPVPVRRGPGALKDQAAGRRRPLPAAPPAASRRWAGRSGPVAAVVVVVVEAPRDARRPQATPAQQPSHGSINPSPINPTHPHVRRTGIVGLSEVAGTGCHTRPPLPRGGGRRAPPPP